MGGQTQIIVLLSQRLVLVLVSRRRRDGVLKDVFCTSIQSFSALSQREKEGKEEDGRMRVEPISRSCRWICDFWLEVRDRSVSMCSSAASKMRHAMSELSWGTSSAGNHSARDALVWKSWKALISSSSSPAPSESEKKEGAWRPRPAPRKDDLKGDEERDVDGGNSNGTGSEGLLLPPPPPPLSPSPSPV